MYSITDHNQHYAPGDVEATLSKVFAALGKDGDALTTEELAPLDQFHTGGIIATRSLAQKAGIKANDKVLDVGGGLGGSARFLAQEYGCQVTVLDLTEVYCRLGERLTARTRLTDRVHFQHGNALDMPFEDSVFDVVWTQHTTMNISDKSVLYAQIRRVLRAGGRLAQHEVMAGSLTPVRFPAMWAHDAASSFLLPPAALRDLLAATGFRELSWNDTSEWSRAWLKERLQQQQAAGAAANPLGMHLLLGTDTGTMLRNHLQNLEEKRICIVEGVFEHTGVAQ